MAVPRRSTVALRRRWYRLLELSPRLFCAYQRRRFPGRNIVSVASDVVIDGFPGSGNSYAREAFRYANPEAVVASHSHSPAQVREGLRLGKPTVLLVRPPADAVVSWVVRYPQLTAAHGLHEYRRFHTAVRALAPRLVVARFADVRDRYGAVIEAVNTRFGTAFMPFPESDSEAVAAVTAVLDRYAHEVFGTDASWRMSPPSAAKDERKAAVRDAYAAPTLAALRGECEALYRELAALAV